MLPQIPEETCDKIGDKPEGLKEQTIGQLGPQFEWQVPFCVERLCFLRE